MFTLAYACSDCSVRSVPLATGLDCLGDLKKQAGEKRVFSVVSDVLVQDDDSSELGRTFEVFNIVSCL